MRADERESLRKRFHYGCGYCGVRERDAGAVLTVDHFQPVSKGGTHDVDNWIYCCHACNEFKGDFWEPASPKRILNPLRDEIQAHVVEDKAGLLQALTEAGAFHIDRLHLNRPQLVAYRRERLRQQAYQLEKVRRLERIQELEEMLRELRRQLSEVSGDDRSD